jgi:hypothetical protein
MSVVTVSNGALITKDPDASKVVTFDWDTNSLAPTVTIVGGVGGLFEITPIAPSLIDAALTYDNPTTLPGNRKTQLRLVGGTRGQRYEVENTITTTETPPQVKVGTFTVLVQ